MLEDMNNKSWQCEITSLRHHLWKFAYFRRKKKRITRDCRINANDNKGNDVNLLMYLKFVR